MASQGLACVWQALSALNPDLRGQAMRGTLRTLTAHFAHIRRIKPSPEAAFCAAFPEQDDSADYAITLAEYSAFVAGSLRSSNYALWLLEDDIEHVCWDMCARRLEAQGHMAGNTMKHLWQIFGRLCERESLPPTMPRGEVEWLVKKIRLTLCPPGEEDLIPGVGATLDPSFRPAPKLGPQTFEDLLELLDFKEVGGSMAMQKPVDEVHAWLVKEVLKSGYMWKRTRKQKDWTDWRKRWFVLTPGQLAYYDGPKLVVRKAVLAITPAACLTKLPAARRYSWKLTGCFSLTWSNPSLVLEMAAMDGAERDAWVTALTEVQAAAEVGSTPVRRILSARPRGNSKVNFLADVLRALPFVKPDIGPPATPDKRATPVRSATSGDCGKHQRAPCTCHRAVKRRTKPSVKEPMLRVRRLQSIPEDQRKRIRAIFYSIDKDGNGLIDGDEFFQFLSKLGLHLARPNVDQIFENIHEKQDGRITMEGFYQYFVRTILHETSSSAQERQLHTAFLNADRDHSGTINFREFVEYVWEHRRSVRISSVMASFDKMDKMACGEVKFTDFIEVMRNNLPPTPDPHPVPGFPAPAAATCAAPSVAPCAVPCTAPCTVLKEADNSNDTDNFGNNDSRKQQQAEQSPNGDDDTSDTASSTSGGDGDADTDGIGAAECKDTDDTTSSSDADPDADLDTSAPEDLLRMLYEDAESDDPAEMIGYLRTRWLLFSSFKRPGASGKVVMKGGSSIVGDVVPGEYTLLDLAAFSDLAPLVPRHRHVSGVHWETTRPDQAHGRVVFPPDFDGVIPVEVGTNELLRFYGCSIANTAAVKVSLLYRHAIQDFTYENQYLEDFVTNPRKQAGAGLERHDFSHLDMPLEDAGGYLVLASLDGDEMKLTAFSVPTYHCVYIPALTIHTNDYLSGTWRTMLSDEAPIDHCHLTRRTGVEGKWEKLRFRFD